MRRGVRGLERLREPAAPPTGAVHLPDPRARGVVARIRRRRGEGAGVAAALRRRADHRPRGQGDRNPMTRTQSTPSQEQYTMHATALAHPHRADLRAVTAVVTARDVVRRYGDGDTAV